jgi:hypothetical protein
LTRLVLGALLVLAGLGTLAFGPRGPGSRSVEEAAVFCGVGVVVGGWGALARRHAGRTQVRSWSIVRAASDLRAGEITALQQIQYLLAFLAFELFSWGVDTEVFAFSWNDAKTLSAPIGMGILVVKLLGPYVVYLANGGRAGSDLLNRFIVLSLPIRVRCLVLLLLLAWPARILAAFIQGFRGAPTGDLFAGVGAGLFWLYFSIAHYAWLSLTLRGLREPAAGDRPHPGAR